ncbi:MAG: PD40 domain-containing protein [Gammaproteobacteria bacterium]|nr:PD40 domain-containing protein [Gammaproteobacteria bacterium]
MALRRAAFMLLCSAAAAAPAAIAEQRIANISQGTEMALALTPDGESLIVDLLGRLWQLPASGGGARQLTPDGEAARHPRVGPGGRRIVYQRRVNGQWDLWLLDLESGERRPLVDSGEYDEREPDFSADGQSVVFVSDRTGHDCLWSVKVADGILTQLTEEPGDASFPAVSERGEIAYVRRDRDASGGEEWALRVLMPQGAAVELLRSRGRLTAPAWRPGGGVLIYNELERSERGAVRSSALKMLVLSSEPVIKTLTRSEDVFTGRPAWASPGDYFYTADGQIWRRGIAQVSRHPVHLFAAVAVDLESPPPFTQPLDAPGPAPAFGITGHSFAEDGDTGVFTALGDLWLAAKRDEPRRLTDDEFVDVDASVAPEGDFAVFASDRSGYMDLWRVALPRGGLTQLTNRPAKAHRPAVSPDGRHVAFLETEGLGDAGRAALRLLDLETGAVTRTLAGDLLAPGRPVWQGAEHVAVRVRSAPTSPARDVLLTFDVASGSRGRAPLGPAAAGDDTAETDTRADTAPEHDLDVAIEWRAAAPEEAYVVQVGRLFDGVRSDYRRHVDIHVEGQRITAIVGRNTRPLPSRVIDARDATVIPGLIDVHAHHSNLLGERLGRAWLAYGVTTVRELTDDVAAALERAESWSSGRRLGPRLIVSPVENRAEERAAAPALPTPIPVRNYSGLRTASALFRAPGGGAGGGAQLPSWPPAEHGSVEPPYLQRTSPLNLTYGDVFGTVVESGTVVTSNLAAAAGVLDSKRWSALLNHPTVQRLYTPAERALWLDGTGTAEPRLEALKSNIVRLVRSGGRVAAGTESPAIPYGLGLHLELALLAEAGIPADQVLRIATASNAMALGLERQLGTLEEGKLADFVVVGGNPLTDLTDAMDVAAVVRGGVWLERERLAGGP